MPDEFQFDVFLSHSAKDKAVVRPLAERWRADGVKVSFDEWVLQPGDSLSPGERARVRASKFEQGLERSRMVPLAHRMGEGAGVRAAHAFGSDWAQLESGTFRFRDPLNKERRFLPLRLDDAPIKGSDWFRNDDVSWKFAKTDQSHTPATLRDTLLPMLLVGELSVEQPQS